MTKSDGPKPANEPDEPQKLVVDPKKRRYRFEVPSTKNELVREILKRWWYGLPPWPNPAEDYPVRLRERGYRIVARDDFINEPEEADGLRKVSPVDSFPGVFLDSKVT